MSERVTLRSLFGAYRDAVRLSHDAECELERGIYPCQCRERQTADPSPARLPGDATG